MLNRTAILSAILLGLAVPSSAQEGNRNRKRDGVSHTIRQVARGATRTVTSPRARRGVTRTIRSANPVLGRKNRRTTGGIRPGVTTRGPRLTRPRIEIDRGHGHASRGYHYETRRVWERGEIRHVLVPAEYVTRWDSHCGRYVRVCVREAYYKTVEEHGHWVYRQVLVRDHHGRRRGIHIHF